MNRENIKRTIESIEMAAPERLQMGGYLGAHSFERSCCTVGCLAGWAWMTEARLQGKSFNEVIEKAKGVSVHNAGREFLGLDPDTADKLFLMQSALRDSKGRPKSWGISEFDSLHPLVRRQAAINVLTLLYTMGTVEWDKAIKDAEERHRNAEKTATE